METRTPHPPSFTVSLRGYDREEVDEYIDSLAEALGQIDLAKEQNRRLHAHIDRLTARIKELEERISSDTPRTGGLAAERIAILLRSAEDTAADAVNRAEATAAQIVSEANAKLAEAEEAMRAAVARGEAHARSIEASARSEAAEIIAEAEARASVRTRQIEQWAEEVVSRTRAEEARALRELQQRRSQMEADLTSLAERREEAVAVVGALHETLGKALGLISGDPGGEGAEQGEAPSGGYGPSEPATAAPAGRPGEAERSPRSAPAGSESDGPERTVTGGAHEEEEEEKEVAGPANRPYDAEAADTGETKAAGAGDEQILPTARSGGNTPDNDDEFEAKLEAWVSEGSTSERD